MVKKFLTTLVVMAMIGTLAFYSVTLYQYLPQDPISLSADEIIPDSVAIINYGVTPVFASNLRFNHVNISYFIKSECSLRRQKSMQDAINIFEDKMKLISFYETSFDPDIVVECSDEDIPFGYNLFAAGEGGPSKIINTSFFKTIEKGKISLYDDQRCNTPIVELHELFHVFGFDHSENPSSIMYNVSKCNQRITSDMITIIDDLYSIEPLADAVIEELIATKRGRYLDFNISILNEGLLDIKSINLTILVNDEVIQTVDMEQLEIGYGRSLSAKNIRLPSAKTTDIVFELDYENSVREMNELNNIRKMSSE